MTRRERPLPAMFKAPRLAVYCCEHVFRRERPVLLVTRAESDWQFLCGKGDHQNAAEPYHVAVGVLTSVDPSLHEVSDLPTEWEAERASPDDRWVRTTAQPNA